MTRYTIEAIAWDGTVIKRRHINASRPETVIRHHARIAQEFRDTIARRIKTIRCHREMPRQFYFPLPTNLWGQGLRQPYHYKGFRAS